jgi:dihydroorotase-like cyclic amidohydrolase
VAGLGPGAVLNIHAENHDLVEWTTARMKAQGPQAAGLPDWTATHPALGEAEAVQRAVLLAEQAGTRLYFVHISSAEALRVIRRLKSAGGRFFVETTSPYLSLTDQTDLGALAKMVPPVRGPAERQALWEALQADLIDAIGSDHTPLTRAEKKAGAALWEVMPGYPAVGTHLPSLLHFARRFDFPLLRLAEKTALNPARIFGLYPAKGTLLPGSDADLVVVDPGLTRRVEPARMASRSDFALHQGDELTGWPTAVFKGGIPMVMDGRPCENLTPAGRYLGRGGTP